MAYTVAILNTIRDVASTDYQDRIPVATQTNINTVGNAILNYTNTYEEFTTALINKIGLTVFANKMAKNRLAKFKKGLLPFGKDVEEIFVEMASAEGAFDKTGANPLGLRASDVKVMYHRENRRGKYVKSLSKQQVKTAFRSADGVTQLLSMIVNSIYSGANHDEYLLMKELLAKYELNYFNYEVDPITDDAAGAIDFIKTVRKAVQDLSFMDTAYNKAGVNTFTDKENLVLLVNKDVIAHTDVDVLAKAFNMGKSDFEPEIIVLDNFGAMIDTYGVLVDKDFFMVYDTLVEVAEEFNADGLFRNYFFHIWQILSTSQFKNAVRFKKVVPI